MENKMYIYAIYMWKIRAFNLRRSRHQFIYVKAAARAQIEHAQNCERADFSSRAVWSSIVNVISYYKIISFFKKVFFFVNA